MFRLHSCFFFLNHRWWIYLYMCNVEVMNFKDYKCSVPAWKKVAQLPLMENIARSSKQHWRRGGDENIRSSCAKWVQSWIRSFLSYNRFSFRAPICSPESPIRVISLPWAAANTKRSTAQQNANKDCHVTPTRAAQTAQKKGCVRVKIPALVATNTAWN